MHSGRLQLFPFDEFANLEDDNSRLALVMFALEDTRLLRWLDKLGRHRRYRRNELDILLEPV